MHDTAGNLPARTHALEDIISFQQQQIDRLLAELGLLRGQMAAVSKAQAIIRGEDPAPPRPRLRLVHGAGVAAIGAWAGTRLSRRVVALTGSIVVAGAGFTAPAMVAPGPAAPLTAAESAAPGHPHHHRHRHGVVLAARTARHRVHRDYDGPGSEPVAGG